MGSMLGSLFGGIVQGQYDNKAANQANEGYNYLTQGGGSAANSAYVNNGGAASNQEAALLGIGSPGAVNGAQNAFKNYLGSTGYNFQLKQGQNAISGNAAAQGDLNSGATGKALTQYGQNLGSNYFNNYIGQLSGVAGAGQNALNTVANAGNVGGGNMAGYTQNIGQDYSNAFNGMMGGGGAGGMGGMSGLGSIFGM